MSLFKILDHEPEPININPATQHCPLASLESLLGQSWNVRNLWNPTSSSAMEEGLVNLLHSVRVVCVPGLLWRLLAIALTVRHPALRSNEGRQACLLYQFNDGAVFRISVYYYADQDPGPYFSPFGSGSGEVETQKYK